MKETFYLPILKSKEGEFVALYKLDTFTRKHICPLFEVNPLSYDNETRQKPKTLEEHLNNFCKRKFIKRWFSDNSFIDTALLDCQKINGLTCLEYIYFQLNSATLIPLKPIPVARIDMRVEEMNGLKNVVRSYNISELAIRLKIEDIVDAELEKKLYYILSENNKSYKECHLIFDLGSSDFTDHTGFSDAILSSLESFPSLNMWHSFTICGGAFPSSNLIKKGFSKISRLDWLLYLNVIKGLSDKGIFRKINFGDYSIVAPGYFEFDPKKMSRSANIRYTAGNFWVVNKGSALKKAEDHDQYPLLAKDIYSCNEYFGEMYSQGDLYIKNCSEGNAKKGNPTTWNWVGNNHHFTKVVYDLFANRSGS